MHAGAADAVLAAIVIDAELDVSLNGTAMASIAC